MVWSAIMPNSKHIGDLVLRIQIMYLVYTLCILLIYQDVDSISILVNSAKKTLMCFFS